MNNNTLKSIVYFAFCCLLFAFGIRDAKAVDPPQMTCAIVNNGGNVTLQWTAPADPGNDFFNYKIYYREGGGNFSFLIDYGGIGNTTFFHSGIDANTSTYSYYIITEYGVNGIQESIPSDTITTMRLNVLATDLGSVAQLNWNSQFQQANGDGASGFYKIYKEYPAGNWQYIDEVPYGQNTYRDTIIDICPDPVEMNYRIEVENLAGCSSVSSVNGGEFRDLLGPQIPQVETVTVDPLTGEVVIYWYPSSDPDVAEYLVQLVENGNFINISNQNASEPTEFIYQGSNPVDVAASLVVIAFDNCNNDNSYEDIYQTILLKSEVFPCDKKTELSWSPYEGWDEGVLEYRVYVAENGGADNLIAVLPSDQIEFEHTELSLSSEYCYRIEAVSNGTQRPSFSNQSCEELGSGGLIQNNYISNVTVNDDNIEIEMYQDPAGLNITYELFRSESNRSFKKIHRFPLTDELWFTYTDSDVNPSSLVYRYKLVAFDYCGDTISVSNSSRNIQLNALANTENLEIVVSWNSYTEWDGGVQEYQIFRRTSYEEEYTYVESVTSNQTTYIDDVSDDLEGEGLFCYKIIGVESPNSYNNNRQSESNEACASQEPLVWIPNTIVINGFNNIFKPVVGFIDRDTYRMEIIDRWGQIIFESDEVESGWDGTFNGGNVRESYNFYIISFNNGAGRTFVKKGEVYVIQASEP